MSHTGPSSETVNKFGITFTSTFRNGVKIPEVIFNRFMEGKPYNPLLLTYEGKHHMMWGVETEGRKLGLGWNKFAKDNEFMVGDLIIFEYTGDSSFHVTNYGNNWENRQEDEPQLGNEDAAQLGNDERFVTFKVTADKMENERMYLPKSFSDAHGLYNLVETDVFMVGFDETKFAVTLKAQRFADGDQLQLAYGLRGFLESNDITVNDAITMEMLRDDISPPTLKLRSKVVVVPN